MEAPKSFRSIEIGKPSFVRTIAVACALAAAWFVLGWLFASVAWGVGFALWSLVLGPILVPIALRVWAWRRFGLRRLDLAGEWALSGAYFDCLLKYPGLQPEVWVFSSVDPIVFWDEPLLGGRTRIFVSRAWLKIDSRQKSREWHHLWQGLVALRGWGRRVRSLQFRFWLGALSPVAVLFEGLGVLMRVLGFRDLPSPAFWFQRAAWSLRALWMKLPRGQAEIRVPRRGAAEPPRVWNSLLLGPWAQLSSVANGHPTWRLLVHRGAFVEIVS